MMEHHGAFIFSNNLQIILKQYPIQPFYSFFVISCQGNCVGVSKNPHSFSQQSCYLIDRVAFCIHQLYYYFYNFLI